MPNADQPFDVAIVGGNLNGQALALALRDALPAGFRIALVERLAAGAPPALDARAYAVSLASQRFLEAVGVWSEVASGAEPLTEIDITDATTSAPIRPVLLHYDNQADERPASHIVPGQALQTALDQRLRGAGGIDRFDGQSLESLDFGSGAVTLGLSNGRRVQARLAVAADGRASRLRSLAGIKTIGWSYGQHGIVTTVGHELAHGGRAIQHFLPAGPFAILPLKGGHRSSLVWSERSGTAQAMLALDDAAFLEEVRLRFSGRLGELTLEGPRQSFPLDLHLARSFYSGRVVLVGDAARGVHPLAGQGLNIGLRDVAALAEIIVETARLGLDIGSAEPLHRYQRWRRFDSVASALGMDGLNRLFSNDNAAFRAIRDLGLGLVDRSPALKRMLVAEAAGLTGEVPRLLRGEPI
jgi:2-octaprenyl-6-methoxyphenol hydroxylase